MIRRLAEELLGPRASLEVKTRWWQVTAILLIGTAVALLRLPMERWNVLWAEDGADFLTGALRYDPLTVFEPYFGYLHVVPRLVGALAAAIAPLEWMPFAMNLISAAVAAGVACLVYLFARLRIGSVVICALLALFVVALPIAGGEVAASAANLHWYLSFGAFWAAIVTPRTRWLTIVQCAMVALAVLSDPLAAALLFPLIVVRLAGLRPFWSGHQAVSFTYAGAAVIQGVAVVLQTFVDRPRQFSQTHPGPGTFSDLYTGRVVLDSLVGVRAASPIIDAVGRIGLVVLLLLVLAGIATLSWKARERRVILVVFTAASIGLTYLEMYFAFDQVKHFDISELLAGSRYWVAPVLLLFSVYAIGADYLADRLKRLRWIPIAVLAIIVVLPAAFNFRLIDIRTGSPDWQLSIAAAAESCSADDAPDGVEITIAPPWFRTAYVPCSVIDANQPH